MSRHQQFKKDIKNLDYNEDYYSEDDNEEEFSEVQKINYIMEELDFQIQEHLVRNQLQQLKGDEYATIDYLIKQHEQKKDKKQPQYQPLQIGKTQDFEKDNFQQKDNTQSVSRKTSITLENQSQFVNTKRRISREIMDIIEPSQQIKKQEIFIRDLKAYNSPYQQIKNDKIEQNNHINLAIVGHVDSGKSTLIGQILYQNQQIEEKVIRKYDKESSQQGKKSFKYAWVMDQRDDEREKGITIDVGMHQFRTKNRQITILDTPGHKDFVPNMIYGAAQADVAILMIDANDFEQGFENGQTKEHAILVKSLGVNQIIVTINKMDVVYYSQERFDEIQQKILSFLQDIGFNQNDIQFIPISGLLAENIKDLSKNTEWYKQNTLLQIIDQLNLTDRDYFKPLRMSINNFYHQAQGKLKGFCLQGKIESGNIKKGQTYLIQPQNLVVQIKDMQNYDQKIESANVGDSIDCSIQIQGNKTIQTGQFINVGNVLCDKDNSVPISNHFLAEIMCFDVKFSLLKGSSVILHINSQRIQGQIVKLIQLIDRKSGNTFKKNPKCVKSNECALIEIKTEKMVCLELYSNIKAFGRITIREKQNTIAIGLINQIY